MIFVALFTVVVWAVVSFLPVGWIANTRTEFGFSALVLVGVLMVVIAVLIPVAIARFSCLDFNGWWISLTIFSPILSLIGYVLGFLSTVDDALAQMDEESTL